MFSRDIPVLPCPRLAVMGFTTSICLTLLNDESKSDIDPTIMKQRVSRVSHFSKLVVTTIAMDDPCIQKSLLQKILEAVYILRSQIGAMGYSLLPLTALPSPTSLKPTPTLVMVMDFHTQPQSQMVWTPMSQPLKVRRCDVNC